MARSLLLSAATAMVALLPAEGGLFAGHQVPVPAVEELEILDPGVDPEGKPRAVIVPGPDGEQIVEIPQTVIVHKFFVPGADREFQAPLIPGGPTIIVVNHPRTGERLYVETNLLPGIPRIKYHRDCIIYDYGHQAIMLKFGPCGNPKVIVCGAHGLREGIAASARHVGGTAHEWIERTGIPNAMHHVGGGARDACMSTADRIHDVGSAVAAPLAQTWESLPFGQLMGSAEERAARLRDAGVQRATREQSRFEGTIPTLR